MIHHHPWRVPAGARQSEPQNTRGNSRRRWQGALLWATFAAGLAVQAYGPRLKVEHNTFIVPPSLSGNGMTVNPVELVARERRVQMLSAILTVTGALGLAFYYRYVFVRPPSPNHDAICGSR